MKKFLVTLIAAAAFASTALAAEVNGVVSMLDESLKTITLEDGSSYKIADGVITVGVVPGVKVKVVFDEMTKEASAIEIAKM
jgi:hypothetical protein